MVHGVGQETGMTSRCNQLSQSCSVCAAVLGVPLHSRRTGTEYLRLGISQKILSVASPFMIVWSGQVFCLSSQRLRLWLLHGLSQVAETLAITHCLSSFIFFNVFYFIFERGRMCTSWGGAGEEDRGSEVSWMWSSNSRTVRS